MVRERCMSNKSILILGLVLLLVGGLAGCGDNQTSSSSAGKGEGSAEVPATCRRDPIDSSGLLKIAVVPMGTTHEFWKAIHAGAVKAERERDDVQIIWKGPIKEDDREQQINVVENFINVGVSAIALAPLDNVALVRPVREAKRAGIATVIMDSPLSAGACTDYVSFVGTDNYAGGQKGARRLGQLLGGKGRVVMMRCLVGFASTMRREQGFLETMAEAFPEIEIVSADQYGGATTESAYAKAENLLNRFGQLDGVFCPNESTTFGMLLALRAADRADKIKFVGFDSSAKFIDALAGGELDGLVLQDPLNIGYTAVKTLVAYLRGETVQTRIDTGCVVATPANMNEPAIRTLLSPPIDQYLEN